MQQERIGTRDWGLGDRIWARGSGFGGSGFPGLLATGDWELRSSVSSSSSVPRRTQTCISRRYRTDSAGLAGDEASARKPMKRAIGCSTTFAFVLAAACGGGNTRPQGEATAPGADRTAKT